MSYTLKKIHVAITALLLTVANQVHSDYGKSSIDEMYGDSCSCASACCVKGFVSADLLYWRAFESGLDTCVPREVCDIVTSDGKVISRFSGKDRDPHFEWNPGFRIGTGYEFACWDIGAFWTHLHSRAHDSKNDGNKLRWNIDFDVIDILAEYKSDLGSYFTLRPFGGLRGARIDQRLRIHEFSCCSIKSSTANDLITIGKHNKENFWGVGPLIGLEADWNIGCGFSLYISASTSWLYGKFHVRLTEFDESVDAISCWKVKKHLDASLAVADAALGICWHTCFCTNKQLILQFGLEHHRYFDYNRIGGYGDLSFDGVNFSAAIEF